MKTPIPAALLSIFAATVLFATGCQDDSSGGDQAEMDDESCQAMCEDHYAQELEASAISSVESLLEEDQCTCTFHPCDNDLCTDWCVENEGIDQGVCQLLECNCIEET